MLTGMNPRTSHFGPLMRQKRTAARITLGDVASALGCSISYVSDVEHGRRNPFDHEQIRKLAPLLSCPAQELMRAAARDTMTVKISSHREEILELAAHLASVLQSLDDAGIGRLRKYLEDEDEDSADRTERTACASCHRSGTMSETEGAA